MQLTICAKVDNILIKFTKINVVRMQVFYKLFLLHKYQKVSILTLKPDVVMYIHSYG